MIAPREMLLSHLSHQRSRYLFYIWGFPASLLSSPLPITVQSYLCLEKSITFMHQHWPEDYLKLKPFASFHFLHSIPFRFYFFFKKKKSWLKTWSVWNRLAPAISSCAPWNRRASEARGPRRFQNGDAKRGQRPGGPSPRGTFNNSLTLYAVGQGLICCIWGDSSRFCYSIAGVWNKCSPQRLKAAFVILAMGGHGNRRRFGNSSINPLLRGADPAREEGVHSFPLTVWFPASPCRGCLDSVQKQNLHQLLERKPTLFLKVWQQKYSLLRKGKKKKRLMNSPLFSKASCGGGCFFFLFQSS